MSIHESLVQTDDAQIEIETTADVIKPFFGYGRKLVDELKVHVDSDGIRYEAVAPANVAMVGIDVPAEAFDTFNVDETVVGLHLKSVMGALRLGRQRKDDRITLSYDNEMLSTTVQRDYDGTNLDLQHNIKTIDPDSLRSEPDIPNLNLPVKATVPRTLFEDTVNAINQTSDHIRFTDDGDDLVIAGEGATNDTRAVVENAIEISEGCDSIFSLDYFTNGLTGALKKTGVDEITIRLGEEFPVKFEWETEMNGATVSGMWFQAPRIKSE